MLFDFLRRRRQGPQDDVGGLKDEVKRFDKDLNTVFDSINAMKASGAATEATVSDLKAKMGRILKFGKLVIRTYDELKVHSGRLEKIEKAITDMAVSANTHNYVRASTPTSTGQTLSILTQIPQTSQTQTEEQLFSERSVNSVNNSVKSLNNLTDMEKKTFVTLSALISESEAKEIDYGVLVQELYPAIPAEKRRSTVSNFLKKLESAGLIKRQRRGRRSMISLTQVGLAAIGEENFKRLRRTLFERGKLGPK